MISTSSMFSSRETDQCVSCKLACLNICYHFQKAVLTVSYQVRQAMCADSDYLAYIT